MSSCRCRVVVYKVWNWCYYCWE